MCFSLNKHLQKKQPINERFETTEDYLPSFFMG